MPNFQRVGGVKEVLSHSKLKRKVNLEVDGRVLGLPQIKLFDVHFLYFDLINV